DGLAVFSVTMQPSAINHVVLVQMMFTDPKTGSTCNLSSPAFFTAIIVSPTPSSTSTLSPTASPFGSPTPGGSPTVSPPTLTPSPTRTKTPAG
ncbi:MAG TPA: hypothetical protein VKR83_04250, partial [Ktedonobacteraceae bacterium]|nr:hypothetical protein [Ktedonobacteraceae bacterium]